MPSESFKNYDIKNDEVKRYKKQMYNDIQKELILIREQYKKKDYNDMIYFLNRKIEK